MCALLSSPVFPNRPVSSAIHHQKMLVCIVFLVDTLVSSSPLADKTQLVRRAVSPSGAAAQLKGLTRHRYELMHESTQRKNKLIAICDELFPEFTHILKNPTLPSALSIREKFPTPQAIATATITTLCEARVGTRPSKENLMRLQQLAAQSIGTKDVNRQRGLILEQKQMMKELKLLQEHLEELDTEICHIVEHSREGQILLSMQVIGPIQAAAIISAISHIENFTSAAALKSYFGWAPKREQTGTSYDRSSLTHTGTRTMRQMMFLVVANAIQMESEWAKML